MSIREKENELFKDYVVTDETKTQKDIVPDGVIDEASFLNAEKKILFLLKEVNGGEDGKGVTDLRDFVLDNAKGRWQTWDNVYRWVRTILESDSIRWEDVEEVDREKDRLDILKQIAVMNVKKTSGGSSADDTELKKAAEANKEVLKKQIELYDADYIICGNTYFLLECLDYLTGEEMKPVKEYYLKTEKNVKPIRPCKYYIKSLKNKKQIIVNFYHPGATDGKGIDFFNLLLEIIKDAEKEIK